MHASSLFSMFCFNWLFQEIVTIMKHDRLMILKINIPMRPLPCIAESVTNANTIAWMDVAHRSCKLNMLKSEHKTNFAYISAFWCSVHLILTLNNIFTGIQPCTLGVGFVSPYPLPPSHIGSLTSSAKFPS